VAPTHDAYLENGTFAGLTVGIYIVAHKPSIVKLVFHCRIKSGAFKPEVKSTTS
jgi:hypothetical protein